MAFQPNPPGVSSAKTFPQWLSFALSGPNKFKLDGVTPAACTLISLNHIGPGGVEKEIHSVPIGGKKYDDAAVNSLSSMLYGIAQTDAQNLSGKQGYMVYALYEDEEKPVTRFPIGINGQIVNAPGDVSTESPTAEGRLQQRMRHDEGYSQMLTTGLANLINLQNQFMRVQNDALVTTKRESTEMFETIRTILLEQVKNDREHEMKVLEYERNTKLMAGLTKIAPAMMNTITGREIVPQGTVDTAILETLADVLDEKVMAQLAPIMAKVPPEMQGVLMARLQQIIEQKAEGEERVEHSIGKMDPKKLAAAELDLNGERNGPRNPH